MSWTRPARSRATRSGSAAKRRRSADERRSPRRPSTSSSPRSRTMPTSSRSRLACQSSRRPAERAVVVEAHRSPATIAAMQQMYHPSDLASMDPLVLMKNLDHVRMTSRRLSYILQQQVHLYTPEANQLREQIDRYVEAERQIEGEMARRRIRA